LSGTGLALPLLIGSGVYAAWSDLRFRRLPNVMTMSVAVLGLALVAVETGPASVIGNLLHLLAALTGGLGLYALGGVGAGDVKYYASVSAWFGIDSWAMLLACVSLAGLLLASVWIVLKRLKGRDVEVDPDSDFAKVPFGLAIASGAIAAAWIAP
jgi:prepilin peptidase CpaA